jgi:EAL domain-containing protein (putative c-di-GMP-specific phosphodiesterase class I)
MVLALETLSEIPRPVRPAVNAGPETFCSPELLGLVDAHPPERLIVELTEHVDIDDHPRLRWACSDLRSRSARVAIDDTGSGFAGLSVLLEVAPEIIELDRQLTTGIDADPVRRALAGALVAFAEETGSEVVAEGIETAGELQALADLGNPHGRGFYLARPSFPETLRPLLDKMAS